MYSPCCEFDLHLADGSKAKQALFAIGYPFAVALGEKGKASLYHLIGSPSFLPLPPGVMEIPLPVAEGITAAAFRMIRKVGSQLAQPPHKTLQNILRPQVAFACGDLVRRFSLHGELNQTARAHQLSEIYVPGVACLTYGHTGRYLATGDNQGQVEVWHLRSAKAIRERNASENWRGEGPERIMSCKISGCRKVSHVVFNADDSVVYALAGGECYACGKETGIPYQLLNNDDGDYYSLAASPTDKYFIAVAGNVDGRIVCCNPKTGSSRIIHSSLPLIGKLQFASPLHLAAVGTTGVEMWDLEDLVKKEGEHIPAQISHFVSTGRPLAVQKNRSSVYIARS